MSKIVINCRCKTNTEVDLVEPTGYVKLTQFRCDCGRGFHIHDYVNGMTSYGEVEEETYQEMLKQHEEDARRKKYEDGTAGRAKYKAVEKWINLLTDKDIASIEHQRTFKQTLDRDFVIETILEHCKYEDDLLDELYKKSLLNLFCVHTQSLSKKRDWYIISTKDLLDSMISRSYSSKEDAQFVVKTLTEDKDNYDVAYAIIAVTKGTEISL